VGVCQREFKAIVEVVRVYREAVETASLVKTAVYQLFLEVDSHSVDALCVIEDIYFGEIDTDVRNSQNGVLQEGAIDDRHHPWFQWIIHHVHIDVGVVLVSLINSIVHVASDEISITTGGFGVELYLPAGDQLERNEHLVFDFGQFLEIGDSKIVELVDVRVALLFGGVPCCAVNDYQVLGGETYGIEASGVGETFHHLIVVDDRG
jgi:hypothetical protein